MSVEKILFGRHNIANFLYQTTDLHFVFIPSNGYQHSLCWANNIFAAAKYSFHHKQYVFYRP